MPEVRRAIRPAHGRVLAGVAAAVATNLRIPLWLTRVAFVVLALAGGIGVALYAALWVLLPVDRDDDAPLEDATRNAAVTAGRLLALAAIAIGLLLTATAFGWAGPVGPLLPLVLAVVGAAVVWQQADVDQRARWSAAADRAERDTARAGRWRIGLGIGLAVAGIVGLIVTRTGPAEALQSVAIALLILLGVTIVLFPLAYQRWRSLGDERRALIRAEERAEVAAHVHDSVLQTLVLIQRQADDPQTVLRLARTEERALRGWLYAPTGDPERTLAAALRQVAVDVESEYGAEFDVVVVGDGELDSASEAVVAAAREALVNAARHGGGRADVYAEVTSGGVEVFIRDRGPGFDPDSIAPDRHGVRESIMGRMERHGGTATIARRGESGTEVHLVMPSASRETP